MTVARHRATAARRDPRARDARSPARARHRARPHPGHDRRAHARRPRRHPRHARARPRSRGSREAAPARRPLIAGRRAGRPGAAQITRTSTETSPPTPAASFEAAFVDLCDRYGLPTPVMNAKIDGYEVDATGRSTSSSPRSTAGATTARARRSSATARATPSLHAARHRHASASPTSRSRTRPGWVATRRLAPRSPAWIFFIAPFRRVGGSGGVRPRSSSAAR